MVAAESDARCGSAADPAIMSSGSTPCLTCRAMPRAPAIPRIKVVLGCQGHVCGRALETFEDGQSEAVCIDACAAKSIIVWQVFTEAEVRASVVFQLSGLLSTLLKAARQAADCDEWDALVAGAHDARAALCNVSCPISDGMLFCRVGEETTHSRQSGAVVLATPWLLMSVLRCTKRAYTQRTQSTESAPAPVSAAGTAVGELVEVASIEEADLSDASKDVVLLVRRPISWLALGWCGKLLTSQSFVAVEKAGS